MLFFIRGLKKLQIYYWYQDDEDKTNEINQWLYVNKIDWRNMSMEEKIMLKLELTDD